MTASLLRCIAAVHHQRGAGNESRIVAGEEGNARLISALATDAQRKRLLPAIASGSLICALAHGEPAMGFAPEPLTTAVRQVAGAACLSGAKSFVLDAPSAAMFLVTAAEADGLSLFAVPATAPGLGIQPWRTVDGRWAAELQLQDLPLAL